MTRKTPWTERAARFYVVALGMLILDESAWAQTVLWEIQGSAPATIFGEAVASAGDVDGDAVEDLFVGEPGFNPGGLADAGRIVLYSGATQAPIYAIVGPHAGAGLGSVIGRSGDLDGDGLPEVSGRVYQGGPLPWPAQATWIEVYSGAAHRLATWSGNVAAAVGDLDGDGTGDLLIGQTAWSNPLCVGDSGRAYAVSGGIGPALGQWDGWPCAGEQFGFAITPLGDLFGDGTPDFAVSSSGNWNAQVPSSIWLYSGTTGAAVWFTTFSVQGFVSTPPARALAFAGDVDGDGVGDLIAGFEKGSPMFQDPAPPGMARVLSGATGAVMHTFVGFFPTQRFGRSDGHIGDVDGDGYSDLLVGAPFVAPWVPPTPPASSWTGNSPLQGRAYAFRGGTGTLAFVLAEPPPLEGFGVAVEGMGDLDGDEYPDFVVAEAWRQVPNPGRVIAYAGRPQGVQTFGVSCTNGGGMAPRIACWPSAVPGNGISLNLSRARSNTAAFLFLGVSNTLWNGTPLPLGLGSAGMPGCELLVAPDFFLPATTIGPGVGKGHASIALAVPPDPTLSGGVFYAQWYVVDPGPGLVPGSLTRGLQVTIQ